MKKLLGTTMSLKWRHGDREKLWCILPTHPIAAGVPEVIELPEEERLKIIQALRKTNGNRKEAAEILDMSTTTLWRRMQKYNIRL